MNKEQIKHMVDRFLWWRLPEDFHPDCGIQFDADAAVKINPRNRRYEPVGTNLFTATQAEAMVRHMVEGMPTDWQPMSTLPDSDDLVWLLRLPNSVTGPREPSQGDVDDFDMWAPVTTPALPKPL